MKKNKKEEHQFPRYPLVRQAYSKDISDQEFSHLTGLSDFEEPEVFSEIITGEWSNNWVPLDDHQEKP
jgi:hypothetical protein